MQAMLDVPVSSPTGVSQVDAQRAARNYVATSIDPSFEVVSDVHANRPLSNRAVWRFFVRCEYGPLAAIEVDAQSGKINALTSNEIRVLREKAAIFAAKKQDVLPVDAQGHVLGEYARRRADRYLGDHIAMYFEAVDPVFVPGDPPRWQVTIVFKRYYLGPFTLGIMDVDAQTGEPIALSKQQLKRIRERTHALITSHTQTTAE